MDQDPLDRIAEEFAARLRRGETPSVAEYAARHPELADDLRELLPTVAQMELLKSRKRDTSPLPADRPETVGEYRVEREIGRGGMGVVYEAVQASLGRRVAVKVLPPHMRADAGKRERFLREAHASAALHHPHIVPVFAVGEADGVPYFVMPLVAGVGLDAVIRGWRAGKKPDPRAGGLAPNQWRPFARLAAAAAGALQYAHDHGVLHRDVKPGNLLVDDAGKVWVADFGLAKVAGRETLTATGDVLGTVQYMPPEALHGKADERSDVYGLGVTLYELATGRLPFDDANPAAVVRQIETTDPPPPRDWNPDVPRDFEAIVLKAMARDPARRYASAEDLADDLDAFAHDIPVRTADRPPPTGRTTRRGRPPRDGWLVGYAIAATLAAVVGWALYLFG